MLKEQFVTAKVTGKEVRVTDVRLLNMLHGRVVHPRTLGSTLISAGTVDKTQYPNAQVGGTRSLRHSRRRPRRSRRATLPFMKHAPIGPTIAVADARADGTVYVHTHNQNPQALRGQIAMMLGTSVDNVVVRIYAGPGHYGRSNGGNAGAEDEAVLLSKAVGRPVRVQWIQPDDLMWSTQSPSALSNIRLGWDAQGKVTAYEADHYTPAMQDDRLVGALIAGLPTQPAPDVSGGPIGTTVNAISDPWVYSHVANVAESGYGTFQLGQKASPLAIGLRDHSLRTPGQLQQNYPRELAFSEAAALADIDAIEFRLRQTDDRRLIGALEAVRDASGWQTRSSPNPKNSAAGSVAVSGQGVSDDVRRERRHEPRLAKLSDSDHGGPAGDQGVGRAHVDGAAVSGEDWGRFSPLTR